MNPPADERKHFPTWPLLAMLATQSLATMAAYSLPAVAPAVAKDLGVPGALSGMFVSTVYGVGIFSALLSPGFIVRYGAVRVSQFVLLATLAMLLSAAAGSVASIAVGAVLLGLAYGATAPASAHLLVPRTPPGVMNLVLSLRQIGVPLGGVLAGLAMVPLTLALGWREALLWQAAPVAALVLLIQIPRGRWDRERDPTRVILHPRLAAPLLLLRESGAIRRLALASVVYSGLQLCFIAFMTVHLTSRAGFDLIAAGRALAVYQVAGVVSRPIWGWFADRFRCARVLLAAQGVIMCVAAILAGRFAPQWPQPLVLLVCAVAGATASGFTGIAYAEWARLGGTRRTEATGLGAGMMFAGVMLMPSAFSVAITASGAYATAYAGAGLLAAVSGLLLLGGDAPVRLSPAAAPRTPPPRP
ncbi:MAG: MFS transporter [Betaproteobacteria bacterium]|nr:MAG: MFS transporter [Betaproteobacteria bacterium]